MKHFSSVRSALANEELAAAVHINYFQGGGDGNGEVEDGTE